MKYTWLEYQVTEHVALIRVSRPEALNALNTVVLNDLEQVIRQLEADDSVRAAIITGVGKTFVAGADISELAVCDSQSGRQRSAWGQTLFNRLETLEKPIIAAINGYALGGGCELAMACDLRLASEKAVFGQPEIKLGLIPGFGGTQRLPRLVGSGIAKELLYTGRTVAADEALRIGLINAVYPAADLMDEALALAHQLSASSRVIMGYLKAAVNRGAGMDLEHALDLEQNLFGLCFATQDHNEGCSAFLEKRTPSFSHH